MTGARGAAAAIRKRDWLDIGSAWVRRVAGLLARCGLTRRLAPKAADFIRRVPTLTPERRAIENCQREFNAVLDEAIALAHRRAAPFVVFAAIAHAEELLDIIDDQFESIRLRDPGVGSTPLTEELRGTLQATTTRIREALARNIH